MKKVLFKILSVTLILCVFFTGLTACSDKNWQGTSMKNWGAVKSNGGFVAETENYIYYVNGLATSTDDNTFGSPVKGALMAADKSDLSKTEIVVPKLFAATDYKSGLFIDGDYVYYGTPGTDKKADGTIANEEMQFMKTKLDGSVTEELFKVSSLSSEYRIVKGGNTVYIVYYDGDRTALVAFDASAKSETVIAKTDAMGDGLYSLADYNFVSDKDGGVAVLYTTTIYSEPYLSNKVEDGGYSRGTESYNNLYVYKAGDAVNSDTGLAGTLVGKATGYKYEVKLAENFVFYTETTTAATATVKTYGDAAANIAANGKGVEIVNADYAASGNYIVSLSEVYSVADGKLYKSTFVGDDKVEKEVVASVSTMSSILFVDGDTVYYMNSENKIARIALGDVDAKEVVVSDNTASTTWYAPEVVKIGGKDYLFYLDDSSLGASYVKYVDLTKAVTAEDTDDDGEDDKFYIEGATFIGTMLDADKASIVDAIIGNVSGELDDGVLPFEKVDGKLTVAAVTDARAAYEALSADAKALVGENSLTTLANYEKAISMANVYAKLDGMYGYVNKTAEEQAALKTAYNEVKNEIEKFKESSDYGTISALIDNNLLWNYQQAKDTFEAE